MVGAEANHLCCHRAVDRAAGRVGLGAGRRGDHHVHRDCRVDHHDLDRDCRVGNRADCRGVDCHAVHRVGHRAAGLEDLGDRGLGDFEGEGAASRVRGAVVGLRFSRHPDFLPGSQHR